MTTATKLRAREHAQDEGTLRSMVSKAIHESFQNVIRQPLPHHMADENMADEMALLLLRLALAEAINFQSDENPRQNEQSGSECRRGASDPCAPTGAERPAAPGAAERK